MIESILFLLKGLAVLVIAALALVLTFSTFFALMVLLTRYDEKK